MLLLAAAGKANAASISYTDFPSQPTFSHNDELSFRVKLSINTSNDTNYYLRGVFYKKDTNKYCGYTWNNSTFFKGPYTTNEGWKQFLKATIHDDAWEGEIKAKIDAEDNGCNSSGEYGFKVQRFTESGSANFDEQEERFFTFTIPTPTPTPMPTVTPTPTNKPTKTSTPTPTEMTEGTPKKSITPTNQTKKTATPSATTNNEQILGVNEIEKTPTVAEENINQVKKRSPAGKIIMVSGATLLASSCGILMYKKYRKEKDQKLQE